MHPRTWLEPLSFVRGRVLHEYKSKQRPDLLTNNQLMQFGNMPGLGLFSRFIAVVIQSMSDAT